MTRVTIDDTQSRSAARRAAERAAIDYIVTASNWRYALASRENVASRDGACAGRAFELYRASFISRLRFQRRIVRRSSIARKYANSVSRGGKKSTARSRVTSEITPRRGVLPQAESVRQDFRDYLGRLHFKTDFRFD